VTGRASEYKRLKESMFEPYVPGFEDDVKYCFGCGRWMPTTAKNHFAVSQYKDSSGITQRTQRLVCAVCKEEGVSFD